MAQCITKMVLDVSERETTQVIVARQGDSDSRQLRLRLLSYGETMRVEENAVAVLNVKNPEGNTRAFMGTVNADGTLTLPLCAWMLQKEGTVLCDVSVFDEAGGKLTTPCFEIEVVASVLPDEVLPGDDDGGESITAEIVAQEAVLDLVPLRDEEMFVLLPKCRRRYRVNLMGSTYGDEQSWAHIQLALPAVESTAYENWILVSCHAPLRGGRAMPLDWGDSERYRFVGSKIPEIVTEDFDIVCTYSRNAGKWLIGVVQYGAVSEETV